MFFSTQEDFDWDLLSNWEAERKVSKTILEGKELYYFYYEDKDEGSKPNMSIRFCLVCNVSNRQNHSSFGTIKSNGESLTQD